MLFLFGRDGNGEGPTTMHTVIELARALAVLAPLIEDTIVWLRTGRRPDWVATLPERLQSEVTLASIEARRVRG